jgi:LysM repeat protein
MKLPHVDNKSAKPTGTAAWDRSRQRLHAGAILLAVCAFSASAPVWAQDVAEAARQARKDRQSARAKHVYTDEDLKRARILTREDRELLDAKKRQLTPPTEAPDANLNAEALNELPLGDVARMYRAMRELSQAAEVAEYHLPRPNAEFASPKSVATLHEFVVPKPNMPRQLASTSPAAPQFALAAPATLNIDKKVAVAPQPAGRFMDSRPNSASVANRSEAIAPVFESPVEGQTIIVKRGDSFWKLALAHLGNANRWHELVVANPSIVDPNHLVPGTPISLVLPNPVIPKPTSDPAGSTVVVRKGDSLWKIAKIELGSGGFWGCIAKANPAILDANRIYVGQVVSLPSACGNKGDK